MKFSIAIEPGTKKIAFGFAVADLPGCFSAGDTIDEAFGNARVAIKVHCEVLAKEGKELPNFRRRPSIRSDVPSARAAQISIFREGQTA